MSCSAAPRPPALLFPICSAAPNAPDAARDATPTCHAFMDAVHKAPPVAQPVVLDLRRELQQEVEEGVEALLQTQAAHGAEAEAAALKGLRRELRGVEDAIRCEREQLGGEAADVTARTVRPCRGGLCVALEVFQARSAASSI